MRQQRVVAAAKAWPHKAADTRRVLRHVPGALPPANTFSPSPFSPQLLSRDVLRQALSEVLLECAAVFSDVRLSGFASTAPRRPSPVAGGDTAASGRQTSGCGLLCTVTAGPHGLLRHSSGTFSLFCFHTGIVQINACGGASLADAHLLAYNLHAFFSFFRHRIEPPCAALADGSRRKRPLPSWAAPPLTQHKRGARATARRDDVRAAAPAHAAASPALDQRPEPDCAT